MAIEDKYRCEANTINEWYRPSRRCESTSKVRVGGKVYCRKHGSMAALEIALQDGSADDLTRGMP